MGRTDFFAEAEEQSKVKARIVAKYFKTWAGIMVAPGGANAERIAYMDLFSGRGQYDDGTASTPLMVLSAALEEPSIASRVLTFFNDSNPAYVTALRERIDSLPGIAGLKYKPEVTNVTVDDSIAEAMEQVRLVPTLLFVDPWGYKGLSIRLVDAVLKDWACECVFFFNYNRVNAALSNDCVTATVDSLFGKDRADNVRAALACAGPGHRERIIEAELARGLTAQWGRFVLQFRFKVASGGRTSHHLVFVTKHPKGYARMKEIMARESSAFPQGIPSFEFNPADRLCTPLFPNGPTMSDLEETLMSDFAGQRLTMREVFAGHNVGRPFIASNYKTALANLEVSGRITAMPPADKRPRLKGKLTFGDSVEVTFPPR